MDNLISKIQNRRKKRNRPVNEKEIKSGGKIFQYEIEREDNISGKNLVTSVCFNRPQYYKKSINSLLRCRGIENYALIVNQDGDDPETNEFIENIRKIPVIWYKNKSLFPFKYIKKQKRLTSFDVFGCPANIFMSLYRAFEIHNIDKVIVLEDDIVPAPDFLSYFEFCFPIAEDRRIFTISSYFRSLDNARAEDITALKWFCPWGWGIRKEVWDELKQDWDFDYQHKGWDWNLNERLLKNRLVIQPFVSRSQNIGEKQGVHASPEEWFKNQYVPVVSDGSKTDYRFVGILNIESTNQETAPIVSVIIPTLNREKYLRQCIESALSQDYPNLEVIVVDNGSTDNTPEILASFGNRIKCLKEEKRGVSPARNKGLRLAKGELIALLDSDDYYLPGKISLLTKKLLEDRSVSLVYTDFVMVDSDGHPIKTVKMAHPQPEQLLRTFLEGWFGILPSTTLLRKECLEKIGYFDETMEYAEDADVWFKMLKTGCRFEYVPKPLTAYRWHPENHSRTVHKFFVDRIFSSAIEHCAVQEIFGNLFDKKDWKKKVKKGYDKLADTYSLNRLPISAAAAAKKAREVGGPTPHLLLFMGNISQVLYLLNRILRIKIKMTLARISPKLTRFSVNDYQKKHRNLFFKLRYRLSRIFPWRYGLGKND